MEVYRGDNNKILFDGYCPESLLKGNQVEMRLNEDDFWESEATGLQMTVFPPYATILRWRGNGKFRPTSGFASDTICGLMLTESQTEEGEEIFPDEKNILDDMYSLQWFLLDGISKSKEEFDSKKFNPDDPIFEKQQQYLNTLPKQDLIKLFQLTDKLKSTESETDFISSETFNELHKLIYDLKLIFSFRWQAWDTGWKNINDTNFDYANSSLIDLSMYLTAIFRENRFADGTIKENFENGTIDKIFDSLKNQAFTTSKSGI
ncbi:MAG: hypothetical protein H7339_12180 [Arcicella sp.]|nr:hypothetical protein [Arcicella sp.]